MTAYGSPSSWRSPIPLTDSVPRELQIARLVANGATNHAIARALDISTWTVSTHLRRIFAKLNVCTRAEMVAQLFATPHLLSDD